MSELRAVSEQVWQSVQDKIAVAMKAGGQLSNLKEFQAVRRVRVSNIPSPLLVVLSRTVQGQDWGASRGIATQSVVFGATGTSYKPAEVAEVIGGIVWSMADVFLADPTLDGVTNDVRLVSLVPDADPAAQDESTQPWATVEFAWDYEFLRD